MMLRGSFWFLALAMFFLTAAMRLVADLDMYHQMALFRATLDLGVLPKEDIFAFTPTVTPSVHHEWGAGALLYAVAVATGWGGGGVLLLRYTLLAALAVVCYRAAARRGAVGVTMLFCAPVAILMIGAGLATLRAQTYTFLFTACLLLFLERDRQGDRWWIAFWLPIYLVWLNVHGGFVVGLGLFGVNLAERVISEFRQQGDWRDAFSAHRHLLVTFAVMWLLILVNPYGPAYVPFLWESIAMDRPLIREWAPLFSERGLVSYKLGVLLSLILVSYVMLRHGLAVFPDLLLVAVAGAMAMMAQRIVPIYAIVWFCHVPGLLARTELPAAADRVFSRVRPAMAVVAVAVGVLLTSRAISLRPWELQVINSMAETTSLHYPVGAVEYLASTGFSGNLMTGFNYGSYVSWALHPAVLVGLDSRYEAAYPPDLVEEIHAFYAGEPEWEKVLEAYPVDAVLLTTSSPLNELLERYHARGSGRWRRTYQDDDFAIFVRPEIARTLPVVDRQGESIRGKFP